MCRATTSNRAVIRDSQPININFWLVFPMKKRFSVKMKDNIVGFLDQNSIFLNPLKIDVQGHNI
jgi:hypothetical protein